MRDLENRKSKVDLILLYETFLTSQTCQFVNLPGYTFISNECVNRRGGGTEILLTTATLIDNIFVSKALHQDFESAVLLNDVSDHMPILTLLKQTKVTDKTNLEFKSRNLNDAKMGVIRDRLFAVDWIGELSHKTSSENFNKFCSIVKSIMGDVSPEQIIIISHKCKYVEPWMTQGIRLASRKKLELYKKSISKNASMDD